MEKDLTSGSVLKNIFTFSLPYLLSYFLQTLYGMADLFLVPSSMLSTVSALGAQNIGAGKYDRTDDILRYAIAIGVVMGCILTIPQYSIFHALHLINTMLAIIIPCCVSPFGFFLGRVYAQTSMPNELLEHSGRFWPVSGRISPLTGRIGC